MATQAERKRQLANRLRDEAEKINHTNSMRINQHLYIPDLPYGKSLEEIFPFTPELQYPAHSEFLEKLIWAVCIVILPLIFIPFSRRERRLAELNRITKENEKINRQNERGRQLIASLQAGQADAMARFLSDMCIADEDFEGIKFDITASDDGCSVSANIDFPNEDDVPQFIYNARKTSLDIVKKKKTAKEINTDHSTLVHSTMLRVAAIGFTMLPTVQKITGKAFVHRRSKKTGQLERDCILYSVFRHDQWDKINFSYIDPVEVYENFEHLRNLTKTGLLAKLEKDV